MLESRLCLSMTSNSSRAASSMSLILLGTDFKCSASRSLWVDCWWKYWLSSLSLCLNACYADVWLPGMPTSRVESEASFPIVDRFSMPSSSFTIVSCYSGTIVRRLIPCYVALTTTTWLFIEGVLGNLLGLDLIGDVIMTLLWLCCNLLPTAGVPLIRPSNAETRLFLLPFY